jgi:hypothetical protein
MRRTLHHQPQLRMIVRQRIESSFYIDSLAHYTSKALIQLL